MLKNNSSLEVINKNIVVEFDYDGKHYRYVVYKNDCRNWSKEDPASRYWEWHAVFAKVGFLFGEMMYDGFRLIGSVDEQGKLIASDSVRKGEYEPDLNLVPICTGVMIHHKDCDPCPCDGEGAPLPENVRIVERDFVPRKKEDFIALIKQVYPTVEMLQIDAYYQKSTLEDTFFKQLVRIRKNDKEAWKCEEANLAIQDVVDEYLNSPNGYYLVTFVHQVWKNPEKNEVRVLVGRTPQEAFNKLLAFFKERNLSFPAHSDHFFLYEILTAKQDDLGEFHLNDEKDEEEKEESYLLYCWTPSHDLDKPDGWNPDSVVRCVTDVTLGERGEPYCFHRYNVSLEEAEKAYKKEKHHDKPHFHFLVPTERPTG